MPSTLTPHSTTLTRTLRPQSTNKKTQFLGYIHAYRALSALFIVAVHCPVLLTAADDRIENVLLKGSTQLFLFMAGFIFQHLASKFEWKKYYLSKLQFIVLPYLFMNVPCILYRIFLGTSLEGKSTLEIAKATAYSLLVGNQMITFWFVPVICIFYLLAPVLIKLDKDKRIYYFLPFFVGLSLYYTRAIVGNPLVYFIHFFSSYLLGMFFSRNKDQIFLLSRKYFKGLVAVLLVIVAFEWQFPEVLEEQLQYVQKSILGALLLYLFRRYETRVPKQAGAIADMSFGIYLIHGLVLFVLSYVLNCVMPGKRLTYDLENYLFAFGLVAGLTVAFILLVQRLLGRYSRYAIGC
ncbi:acyltransferase [Hymenobacter tibetensis]|uniref:Acyltransferase n=1 Tax=Hymenobacter tibetensis TaxID=497967 RepID=A0ABY4CRS9_9BACT|nr:acyltransferase [Hymenobacter tibetensis]UOG72797.1 acyltransferase [Hymenobacter tibetensis]